MRGNKSSRVDRGCDWLRESKLLKNGGSEWGSNPSLTGWPATHRF